MYAASVEADPSQHWFGEGGAALLPSRLVELEQMKSTIDNDADPSGGRCLGMRCLVWERCKVPSNMIHDIFGGRSHASGQGWAAMTKAALLLGAPDFMGGLPVLKHLPVKIAEFLHTVHGDKFSSLVLPPPGSGGRSKGQKLLDYDQLFERIECVGADKTVIVLHGGVTIGHSEFEGSQRVYAWSFPHKKFRDFNHQDPVLLLPAGADRATFHPDPDNVWYGQCLLVFSFIVRVIRHVMGCKVLCNNPCKYSCNPKSKTYVNKEGIV